ncbi:MAG: diguanylate cyclase [Defluviitaleaceae bacterium]|nr:diguanylate cyclase [Defluviitaleaceae bacterium]MCL2238868.1 diguanylate cyclase [Defluviitaleaceae bacterium]
MEQEKNSILIVDDSSLNIIALTNILQKDYKFYVEKDGAACVATAQKHVPDLILLDILMPGLDGFEVIQALKKNSVTKDIPVIFVTGLDSNQDEERGFMLGAVDYINKPFSPSVVKLRVKNQIQIVNQIRMIHNISITDELTGIGNRRFFYAQLEQEWSHASRHQAYLSFMMIDIDKFKAYNDNYGHMQGDNALRAVAQAIKDCLTRGTDICARWGGEEFAVVLPHTNITGAREVAERVRTHVEALSLPMDNGTLTRVTISVGINALIPPHEGGGYNLNNFVSDADRALYHAKATGRNRACAISDLQEEPTP